MEWGFNKHFWPGLSQDVVEGVVKAAIGGGISWFDTAEVYGNGCSERDLSSALVKEGIGKGDVVIATKWWPLLRTARSIGSTIDTRLECLSPFPIDLYQVHNPSALASIPAQMNAMADLVEAGKIRAVGVSNFSVKMMRKAHDVLARRGVPLASNQIRYNLLARHAEANGMLDAARELGITIICYSPLEFGLLTGKFHRHPDLLQSRPLARRKILAKSIESSRPVIEVIESIADAHSATASQVALSWLVNFSGDTVVAIPGASKPSHAEESAGAMKMALTAEEMERIDEISQRFR
ncbi:MAG: aldo/keto reductase [Chloroflexota bacterium]|nr:aldo/keto reductase [Chloroflexota bacterium]